MTYEKGVSSGALDAGVQLPKPDWEIFDNVLSERGIPRQVMIYPERYMDQFNVTRRRAAIKEMHKRGLELYQLEELTSFTGRYLRDIISNGNEPSLPGFGEKEADVNADQPTRQNEPI